MENAWVGNGFVMHDQAMWGKTTNANFTLLLYRTAGWVPAILLLSSFSIVVVETTFSFF